VIHIIHIVWYFDDDNQHFRKCFGKETEVICTVCLSQIAVASRRVSGICKNWPTEFLARRFPGSDIRRLSACIRYPMEKVTLWEGLLFLTSGSEIDEGVTKAKLLPELGSKAGTLGPKSGSHRFIPLWARNVQWWHGSRDQSWLIVKYKSLKGLEHLNLFLP